MIANFSSLFSHKNRKKRNIMKRYCLLLDLKDDPILIAEYEAHHRQVWEEIVTSIKESGITNLEIFRSGNRLVMLIEAAETFSFEKKAAMDAQNEKVQAWETLMWKYQQALPLAKEGEKWMLASSIYHFFNDKADE